MAQRALARRQSPEGWPPEYLVSSRERRVESERGAVSEVTAEGREADSAARYRSSNNVTASSSTASAYVVV